MTNLTKFFLFSFFAAMMSSLTHSASAGDGEICPPGTMAELRAMAERESEIEVVFFASWCSNCEANLREVTKHRRIYVASFDDAKAAERVAQQYGLGQNCRFDTDITEALNIKALPAKIWLKKAAK